MKTLNVFKNIVNAFSFCNKCNNAGMVLHYIVRQCVFITLKWSELFSV